MAYTTCPGSGTSEGALPGLLARVLRRFTDLREQLSAARELRALSDRQLADIGLARPDAEAAARAAVRAD